MDEEAPWSERPTPSAGRFATICVMLPLGTLLCLLSLVISPYTSWGGEREFLLPDDAVTSRDVSYLSLLMLGAVSVAAWAGRPRWRWWDYPLAIFVAIPTVSAVLRLAYLILKVGLPLFGGLEGVESLPD